MATIVPEPPDDSRDPWLFRELIRAAEEYREVPHWARPVVTDETALIAP